MRLAVLVRFLILSGAAGLAAGAHAASRIEGLVLDVNGRPVAGAQVLFDRERGAPGASVVTVFTGEDGRFAFPGKYPDATQESTSLVVRSLGYEQADARWVAEGEGDSETLRAVLIVRPRSNQASVAPASAWLARIGDRARQSKFIMDCIDCHQVPSSEVRHYAGLIADQHGASP